MLLGRDDKARRHLRKILSVIDMDFPRTIAECDLAILELRSQRLAEARQRMARVLSVVDNEVHLREASRRVRLTAALVEAIAGESEETVSRLLREAAEFSTTGYDLSTVGRAIENKLVTAQNASEFYPLEYLQYWSQNPLAMVPAETLTPQAVFDDVA